MNTRSSGALRTSSPVRLATRLALAGVAASLAALGVSASTLAPASAQTATAAVAPTFRVAPATYEQRVQHLVNLRRADHGLPALRYAACPDGTAQRWSRYLALNDAFFHQSMSNILDRCHARYAGETLGRGDMSPNRLVTMWMHSPGHRAILLSRQARRIGIGATPDAFGRWVVAANFVRF